MKTPDDFNMKSKKPWEVEGVEWREVRLGEVTEDVKPGFALSKQKRRKINANNGIPQLRPYNIANWNKINLDELTYIPKSMDGIEEYFIKNDDVLFNNTNSIELVGRSAVYKGSDGKYTYSNHITRIRVKNQILRSDFLSWYLNYLWNKGFFYLKATKWIGQAGISNKKLLSIKIPIPFRNGRPDLETQKKIVEYIEANFSRIDKILEKKKKELEQLDELWESVLEHAFKPWEVEGVEWREVKLGDIFEIVRGGSPRPIKQYLTTAEDGINWIKISDAEEGSKYITRTKEKIIKEGAKKSRKVYPGDLLLTNSMTVGKAYISKVEGCIHDGWLLFHSKSDSLYPEYFYYLLNSHVLQYKFSKKARGGVVRNLNTSLVKSTLISLPFRNGKPDLKKQKEIANYLDSIYEKIKILKEKIQNQINQLEEMKESILDEVFNHENK